MGSETLTDRLETQSPQRKNRSKVLVIFTTILLVSTVIGSAVYLYTAQHKETDSTTPANSEQDIENDTSAPTDTMTVGVGEKTKNTVTEEEKHCDIDYQYYHFKELGLSFCYPQSFHLEESPDVLKVKNQNNEYPPYSITLSNKLSIYENAARVSSRDKYFKIGDKEYLGKAYSFGDGNDWGYSGGTTWWIEISQDVIVSIYQSESYSIDPETGTKTSTSATDEDISAGEEILESVQLNFEVY